MADTADPSQSEWGTDGAGIPDFPELIPPEHAEGKTLVPLFTPRGPGPNLYAWILGRCELRAARL